MSAKRTDATPLLAAAQAFDDELQRYARLAELFLKAPLTSTKHLDRVNETLGEIGACETRLGQTGRALVEQLTAARQRQESLAKDVVERLPAVHARNDQLRALMGELEQLGAETAKLTGESGAVDRNADGSPNVTVQVAQDMGTRILELAARAADVATHAKDAEFDELARQAHALHQRLLAVGKKLQRPTSA